MAEYGNRNRYSHLPEAVIVHILVRLPAKSLTRFKCTCKNWAALIESSYFIENHFNHEDNKAKLLVYHYRPDLRQCIFTLYPDTTYSRYEEPNHLQFPNTVSVIGPVNSIFCVIDEHIEGIGLWNPAIREFRPLPAAGPDFLSEYCAYMDVFGFGFDPTSDDYKVVWIRRFMDPTSRSPTSSSLISLYSLRGDSWRHFRDSDFGIVVGNMSESKCNTYVNGVYYWLADDVRSRYYILGFDMRTEAFVEMDVPACITSLYVNLSLYYGDIAVLSLEVQEVGKSIDLWVRKEEGWVKQMAIGPFAFWDFSWPFGLWENGELVMETSFSDLVLLNPNTRELWNLHIRSEYGHTRMYSYKESLVSIKKGPMLRAVRANQTRQTG
ncbi:F-box/kelch-repeat protein [Sesamum alatum]|uniref:F-box/kelch-repeat protein n=1 Tax=Sesamum alatum TaxID=300844 RepID=A0AAE1XTI5_9LAMI|nr:F-box/kelch-repeat protein [Sesamum alatum]